MSKKVTLLCALLGLVLLLTPAYAEVQNIKVSGDIDAKALYRTNYDLEDALNIQGTGYDGKSVRGAEDSDSSLMSVVRLRVDADMTDNVAASVRIANAREWDLTSTGDQDDIILDLAYVTLKEMLYSPLTVVVGRQELNYGNGLIVGLGRYQDSNVVEYNDLLPFHGYDAVRGILDYDPWSIEGVMAKIREVDDDTNNPTGTQTRDDDIDLYGVNVGYKFGKFDAEMEGYCFYKRDEQYNLAVVNTGDTATSTFDDNKVYTFGLRGSLVPLENLTLSGEVAGQLGEIYDLDAGPTGNELTRDREAMLANAAASYNFANVRFNPVLGLEYLYLSGEEVSASKPEAQDTGDFEAWDPMYRGKIMGSIRDYLENLYLTNDPSDTSGWTNQHTVKVKGGVDLGELVDGLKLNLAYLRYWFAEAPAIGDSEDAIGDELDLTLAYDYTEDVQFALDGAWFIPGDYYEKVHTTRPIRSGGVTAGANTVTSRVSNDMAVSIIGSCKVTF